MDSLRFSAVATLVVVTIFASDVATAASRSVNISSMWFLPQEGFPVFYRYFKDRITWFEADAVCQFHHANLVTVDTSVQYDATRAYLKELDIATNVWIGLKRVNTADNFAWTDYKKLDPNGGYWQEQVPKSASPLCAATDPAADFRWHSLNCGGPEVASFICELPVPPWARKEDGCLLTALPSLTVIFLPEQGAVELASDCGLDGTRRIACKGQANREEMMRQLSCDHETTSPDDSTGSVTPEVTSSSAGTATTGARTSQSSHEPSTGTTGTRGWTGHSHEPPTRHRRDTDLITGSVTPAVSEETRQNVTTESRSQLPNAGTVASTAVFLELSTSSTTVKEDDPETSSFAPEAYVEEVTTEKQTTNQEPQLSTISESTTYTMTEEVTNSSPSGGTSSSTSSTDAGFIEVRELEVIAENNTGKEVEGETTPIPITTLHSVTSEPSAKTTNSTQIESVGTPEPTELSENGNVQMADLKLSTESKNVTNGYTTEDATTTDATVVSKASLNNTETMEFISAIREEMLNYSVNSNSQKADEIKSREEAEEERLKEEERKEEERKFKEEEENRRRQFLPTPLRSLPEAKASSPPPAPPVIEEYEEPEEVMEPEPEAPARPNRGRRLTRPQPHSFYPYFLNRVLG